MTVHQEEHTATDRPAIKQARIKRMAASHGIVFNATLRCDRCEAQAYGWIILDPEHSNTQLSFCGHHLKENKDAIKGKFPRSTILDRTDLLIEDKTGVEL